MHFINKQKQSTLSFPIDSNSVLLRKNKFIYFLVYEKENTKKSYSQLRINKRENDRLPVKIDSNVIILFDRGSYYILVPMDIPITSVQKKWKTISLDPGVKCIITGYSEQKLRLNLD